MSKVHCPYCGRDFDPESPPVKTAYTSTDLMKILGITRGVFERLLKDWANDLPSPEVMGTTRIWKSDAIEAFKAVLKRESERMPTKSWGSRSS